MIEREIEFRGKRVDNGEWVYGHYVECNLRHFILPIEMDNTKRFGDSFISVENETVGQYTGMGRDSKWYEKDILLHKGSGDCSEHSSPYGQKSKSWKGEKIVILKNCGGFVGVHLSAYLKDGDEAIHFIHEGWEVIKPFSLWNLQGWYKKIGTIYDDPELEKP